MYSSQFINKVLKQRADLSIQKLSEKYDISTRTIQNWRQAKLPKGKRNNPNTKLDMNLLIEDVKQYPASYQYETRLGVSATCIWNNLKKLGISYKKNTNSSKSRRRKAIFVQK